MHRIETNHAWTCDFPNFRVTIFLLSYFLFLSIEATGSEKLNSNIWNQHKSYKSAFYEVELLRWSGDHELALKKLHSIINTSQQDSVLVLRVYNEFGEVYRWLGDSLKSATYLKKIDRYFKNNAKLDKIEHIRNLFYRGKLYRSFNQYDSAVSNYNQALYVARLYQLEEISLVGEIFLEFAYIYSPYHLSNHILEKDYNNKAERIFNQTLEKYDIKKSVLYYAIASNLRSQGDFERALNYGRLAEIIYSHYGSLFNGRIAESIILQGNCAYDNRDFGEAIVYYQNAINNYNRELEADLQAYNIALVNSGVAHLYLGNYESANHSFEEAIRINPLNDDEDSLDLAYTYSYQGKLLGKLNHFKNAKWCLDNSLYIYKNILGEYHNDIVLTYLFLGNLFEEADSLETALNYYQSAFNSGLSSYNINSTYASIDSLVSELKFNLFFDKARTIKKMYLRYNEDKDLIEAFKLYQTAFELIRKTANTNIMEESLLNISETYLEDLGYGVQCALELYENTQDSVYLEHLLQFVETNKYFLLQNSISKSNSKKVLGIPDSMYQRERKLLQKINSLKQEINNTTFNNDVEEYEKRLELLNTTIEWGNTRKIWNASNSLNFTLSDLSTSISIDSIKDYMLDEHDVLLEYFQTSDTLYSIAISKNQEKIIRFPKTTELDNHLTNYVSHLFYKNKYAFRDFIKFVNASHFLYEKLVQPALSILPAQQNGNPSRLIIIPDAQLSNVPFESFIREQADTSLINYYGLHYLCRDFIVNYAYSISILGSNLQVDKEKKNKGILALSYSSSEQKNDSTTRNDEFGELPYSAVELRSIRRRVGNGRFMAGGDATEYNFKSMAGNYNIIHLALHGEADTMDLLNSRIIFKDAGNETEDGFLYAHELYGIDLSHTQLAVLSACETGIGKVMQGEGVYSLARGFAYAGCPSIVMSLWKVNDETTAELMDYFYKYISKGLQKDEALQKAKLEYLNNSDDLSAHPTNWAAFIALGNNEPVQIQSSVMKWYYWILMIIVIGGSLMIYRHFRSGHVKSS